MWRVPAASNGADGEPNTEGVSLAPTPSTSSLDNFLDEELQSTQIPVDALDLDLNVDIGADGVWHETTPLGAADAPDADGTPLAGDDLPSAVLASTLRLDEPAVGAHRLSQVATSQWHLDHAQVRALAVPRSPVPQRVGVLSLTLHLLMVFVVLLCRVPVCEERPQVLAGLASEVDASLPPSRAAWIQSRIEPLLELWGAPLCLALHDAHWQRRVQAVTQLGRLLVKQTSFAGPLPPRGSAPADATAQAEAEGAMLSFRVHVYVLASVLQDPSLSVFQAGLDLAATVHAVFARRLPPRDLRNWWAPLVAAVVPQAGHRRPLRRRVAARFLLALAGAPRTGGAAWLAASLLTGLAETRRCSWRSLLARLALVQHLVCGFGVLPDTALSVECLMRWCSMLLQHENRYVRSGAIAVVWTLHRLDQAAVDPFLKDIAPLMMPRLEDNDLSSTIRAIHPPPLPAPLQGADWSPPALALPQPPSALTLTSKTPAAVATSDAPPAAAAAAALLSPGGLASPLLKSPSRFAFGSPPIPARSPAAAAADLSRSPRAGGAFPGGPRVLRTPPGGAAVVLKGYQFHPADGASAATVSSLKWSL